MRSAMKYPTDLRVISPTVVMVCQDCEHGWELVSTADVRALMDNGCPNCEGWVWAGDLMAGHTTTTDDARRADV